MKRYIKGLGLVALAGLVAAAFPAIKAAEAAEVVLYTASNPKIEKVMMEAFKKAHPDIKVSAVNLSTGPITEKAIAEKANPQADVIWMVNGIALEQLKSAGVLEPYVPENSPVVEDFRDDEGFYMGHNATVMGMAVNTKLLKEKGLPMPTSWVDLVKPVYKGAITVAAPTKSGTGLSIFSTMVDLFGWNYIDNLHQNIFQYNSSGSAAARQTASGETVIGLSYDGAILQQVDAGGSVEMVIGRVSPNVVEGAGLLAGAPHPKEGKIFLDWLFSADGAEALGPYIGIGAVPGYGKIELTQVHLWKLRRPLDANAFKKKWAGIYEK